jgi:hypothetical protein
LIIKDIEIIISKIDGMANSDLSKRELKKMQELESIFQRMAHREQKKKDKLLGKRKVSEFAQCRRRQNL